MKILIGNAPVTTTHVTHIIPNFHDLYDTEEQCSTTHSVFYYFQYLMISVVYHQIVYIDIVIPTVTLYWHCLSCHDLRLDHIRMVHKITYYSPTYNYYSRLIDFPVFFRILPRRVIHRNDFQTSFPMKNRPVNIRYENNWGGVKMRKNDDLPHKMAD